MRQSNEAQGDEFTLLDIFLVVAESWTLLAAGTIIAAILGFAFASIQPITYQAVADLAIPPGEAKQLIATDPGLQAGISSFDVAVTEGASKDVSRITVRADARGTVQDQLAIVVDSVQIARQPVLDERRAQGQAQLDQISQRLAEINAMKLRLDEASTRIESQETLDGAAFAELVDIMQRLDVERYFLLQAADGARNSLAAIPETILASPPAEPETIKYGNLLLTTAAAGIAAAAVLLMLIFIRHRIRLANQDPVGSQKLGRIKRAFLLRARS